MTARRIYAAAWEDLLRSWKVLAVTDLAFKLIAFALLTPATTWLLYWLRSRASAQIVADADILRFFVTTRPGVASLILGGSLIFAITALEVSCLLAIGMAGADGAHLSPRGALQFAGARAGNVLRLTLNMVARLLALIVPFGLIVGGVYLGLLHDHDINFYLSRKPPVFLAAVGIAGLLGVGLIAVLIWWIARWALALPLVLFESVSPRVALGESARRGSGKRWVVVAALAMWAAVAVALAWLAAWLPEVIGRTLAPRFAGSLTALLAALSVLVMLWAVLVVAAGIANVSVFSLTLGRLYLDFGSSDDRRRHVGVVEPGASPPLSRRTVGGIAAIAVLAAAGFALLAFLATRTNRPVVIIAHRGASAEAPENTLAAFRLAGDEHADFIELDVQESRDGEVLVVHDSDLMKIGGAPMKIWETDAAELRSVDIGSRIGPQFSSERVPTLAEALAAAKGHTRVVVELKSYGHNEKLEERVAAVVEAAGMEQDCIFMSLDHDMIRRMKQLRPTWTCGVLVAKAIGDLTSLKADFLAVEARMATGRFVRRAHRAKQDVYVWTVNDPAWMLAAMGRGVDGLITDNPGLARRVVARRAAMSDAQRLLVALMVRMGATTKALQAEDALRP